MGSLTLRAVSFPPTALVRDNNGSEPSTAARFAGSTTIPSTHLARACLLALLCAPLPAQTPALRTPDTGWPTYGGNPGGQRFSPATEINKPNLADLRPVWTFHTRALDKPRLGSDQAFFEATPVLSGRTLYFTSPFDQVFALDAATGVQRWTYDPHASPLRKDVFVTSRGVALWTGKSNEAAACAQRVFFGTLDARLIALDAVTGEPCQDFGKHGTVDLTRDVHFQHYGGYSVTSPPTVIGNVVVVGSSVIDNHDVSPESGVVRAVDAVSGRQLWFWEPLPWAAAQTPRTGAGNVWSVISADPELGLVFLPTSSAAPDFYGGFRPGDNRDADSVVALDAATGRRVWGFQVVHHNLWDYDVPAEPVLFTWRGSTPAVAIATKMGEVFVLDRRTGTPLLPVREHPAPPSDVPGENASPTQPVSTADFLASTEIEEPGSQGWRRSGEDAAFCKAQMANLRYDGMFTPPSERGTLLFPGNLGGVNWGGASVTPSGALFANVNRQAFAVRLVPATGFARWWFTNEPDIRDWPLWIYLGSGILLLHILWKLERNRRRGQPLFHAPWLPGMRGWIAGLGVMAIAGVMTLFPMSPNDPHFGYEMSQQIGTPYLLERAPILDHHHNPCVSPPWGSLAALDLNTGKRLWSTPLGTRVPGEHTGSLTLGGPTATATGLVFTAGTDDARLRAFDAATGAEAWSAPLPASARSTPMTYVLDGRQYVVIAAGGHGGVEGLRGDALVAFALPRP